MRVWILVLSVLSELVLVGLTFYATRQYIDRQDNDWRGFGLWIVTISWISPLSFIVFMCCFLPLMVGMAAVSERGEWISGRALAAMTAGFVLLTIVPPIGHPFYPLLTRSVTKNLGSAASSAAAISTMASPASAALSIHHLHWITGARFAALAFTWLAAWWFVTDQQIVLDKVSNK